MQNHSDDSGRPAPYPDAEHRPATQTVARGLGLFGIVVGVAGLVLGGRVARGLGMSGSAWLVRSFAAREIVSGAIILTAKRDMSMGLWARLGADALALATLGAHAGPSNRRRGIVGIAMAVVGAIAVLDFASALQQTSRRRRAKRQVPDYSQRSGLPRGVEAARGIARDFEVPPDMRTPAALRPQTLH